MHRHFLPSEYRDFFIMIDRCEREVELKTRGFHLNLKSKLCQIVVLTSVLCNKRVTECELITHSSKDTEQILKYLLANRDEMEK